MIFEIPKFNIFGIFKIRHFFNIANSKFLEFFKLEILGNFLVANFSNCLNWKINQLIEFF